MFANSAFIVFGALGLYKPVTYIASYLCLENTFNSIFQTKHDKI